MTWVASRVVGQQPHSAIKQIAIHPSCWCGRLPMAPLWQDERRREFVEDLRHRRPPMDQITRVGMDTSKHVFQLHGVNAAEEPVLRKKLRRQDLVAFFGKLPPTVVALEACGGSHH